MGLSGNGFDLARQQRTYTIQVGTSLEASTAINFKSAAGAVIRTALEFSPQVVTFYVSDVVNGTYVPLYDENGDAVTRTYDTGKGYELPQALFGAAYVKMVAATTEFRVACMLKG